VNWEVWGPPLLILAGGLAVGAFLATSAGSSPIRSTRDEELRARHDSLLDQIRELDADRGKLDAATYSARREALISQAADTLRELESGPAPAPAPAEPTASGGGSGMIWAGVSVVFFVVLGVLLTQNSFQRGVNDGMTGGTATSAGGGGGSADASGMVAALEAARTERQAEASAALAADPRDLAAINTLTYDALLYRDLDAAMRHVESARDISESDADVLIHLAILQSFVGMTDRALGGLDEAAKVNPNEAKLRLWRGFLNGRSGKVAEAEVDLAFAAKNAAWPEERLLATGLLDELRTAPPPGPASAVASSGTMPPDHPGTSGMPAGHPPAGGSAVHLKGTISLGEGVVAPEGYTLFLSVRRSPAGGPPAAAQKLTGVTFPLELSLGDAQLLPMAGGAWPEEVWVQARLDRDGNAMTKEDADLESSMQGPLTKGSEGLSFVLQ